MVPFSGLFSPQPKSNKKGNPMLKAFNAFQIVAFFAASPFGISYLFDATFPAARVAAYASVVGYGVFFVLICAAVFTAIEKD